MGRSCRQRLMVEDTLARLGAITDDAQVSELRVEQAIRRNRSLLDLLLPVRRHIHNERALYEALRVELGEIWQEGEERRWR